MQSFGNGAPRAHISNPNTTDWMDFQNLEFAPVALEKNMGALPPFDVSSKTFYLHFPDIAKAIVYRDLDKLKTFRLSWKKFHPLIYANLVHSAVICEDTDALHWLLEEAGPPNAKPSVLWVKAAYSFITATIKKDSLPMFKLLLDKTIWLPVDVIELAAKFGRMDMLALLVENGCPPDAEVIAHRFKRESTEEYRLPLIAYAIKNEDFDLCETLFRYGASLERDYGFNTSDGHMTFRFDSDLRQHKPLIDFIDRWWGAGVVKTVREIQEEAAGRPLRAAHNKFNVREFWKTQNAEAFGFPPGFQVEYPPLQHPQEKIHELARRV